MRNLSRNVTHNIYIFSCRLVCARVRDVTDEDCAGTGRRRGSELSAAVGKGRQY